ncbi:MAG: sensor histidine kinase [Solirubrobacteraceae bacterium]
MTDDPPSPDERPPALVHEALLYRDRGQLERAVSDFVRSAAQAGEPVLALLPSANLEWLPGALGELADNVQFRDMGEAGRNPSLLLSVFEEWLDEHDGRARLVSEPVWPGRSYAEIVECLRHEALVNHALADSPATILCPYDAEHLDSDTLGGAELTHPQLIGEDGESHRNPRFGELADVLTQRWPMQAPHEPISEFPFDGDLGALRRAVSQDPAVQRLSLERRFDMIFAINEAVTNAYVHGDGSCRTRIWEDGSFVVSEVSSAPELSDMLVGRRRPPLEATAGRGLWLINEVCDLVELRSGHSGTTVRMHVRT